jgi:uncharacterized protein (DUF58 family)
MISPEIIKKIKRIHIKSSRLVNTMMAGQYKSVFRGTGIEFEEVREYTPGDEVKSIDWKVSARLGRPFVKRYREERELIVMLLVDMSASGRFGTTEQLKIDTAAETASILAFNAIRNNDKVGLILFTSEVEKYITPKKGSAHVWRVIKEIFSFEPQYRGTDIESAVRFLGQVSRKKCIAFLISDFITPESGRRFRQQLRTVARKHELIGICITDPGEFRLPGGGILQVQDLETGARLYLDASHAGTRKLFKARKDASHQKGLQRLKSAEIDYIEIGTDKTVADALVNYFRIREQRRR